MKNEKEADELQERWERHYTEYKALWEGSRRIIESLWSDNEALRKRLDDCEGGEPEYDFPLLSQRDLRWSGKFLGTGKTTIGRYGCVITSLAMALSKHYGELIEPGRVNEALIAAGGFTGPNGNLVIWDKVSKAFPEFKFKEQVIASTKPAPVEKIDQWLAAGDYVFAQVDYNVATAPIEQHWVLIVGGDKDAYRIHDPWPVPSVQTPLLIPPAYCNKEWENERGFQSWTSRALFRLVRYGKEE